MSTTTSSSGFRGYKSAMQFNDPAFNGLDRELFNMYMSMAKQHQLDSQARVRFGYQEVKFKPMVYGKSSS